MSNKKNQKLITDKDTDYLFDYFMNEDKFNEQMRGEWDEEMEKKLENHKNLNLDSKIITEKKSSITEKELPSSVEFDSESTFLSDSFKSPYAHKISPILKNKTEKKTDKKTERKTDRKTEKKTERKTEKKTEKKTEIKGGNNISERKLLGEKLINNVNKYAATKEEERARSREMYSRLQDMVEKYNVKLTKEFTIDDNADEMEAEYKMHRERRDKKNQVKFYKQVLLNIVCGAEFVNDKYNPFEFKLKDWSKQMASDMDDYTEVLEEIYEKYKDKGGKMAPEIKLIFMIIMSGVTFHLSNTLFGSNGLDATINNNPNMIGKLLGGLMNNKNEEKVSNNNDAILEAIRKHNQNKTDKKENESNPQNEKILAEQLAIEKEKRLLAEQKSLFEEQVRKQNDLFNLQMQKTEQKQTEQKQKQKQTENQILSPPKILSDEINIFNTEIPQSKSKSLKSLSKPLSQSKPKSKKNKNLDDIIETLEESSTIDIDDIIESSSRKKHNKVSTKNKSESISNLSLTASKKNSNVIKL